MREILFRGKLFEKDAFDDTDWIYGSLIDSGNHSQVQIYPWINGASTMSVRQLVYMRMRPVDPETIGQCTGSQDKNGKWIFEGDIFMYAEKTKYLVTWDSEYCGMYAKSFDSSYDDYDYMGNFFSSKCRVIGNIHDNPELLER